MPTTAKSTQTPFERLVAKYREDHRNPVNNFLHVGVGWPLCAAAVLLLPFRPLWSPVLVLIAYAIMFAGHFLFERNTPTILKHPSTPFVMTASVLKGIGRGFASAVRREK